MKNLEYEAIRSSVGVADLSARPLIRLRGEDRVSFLHGMCTNEIKKLPEGSATYAAFLTSKGGMVADARVLHRKDELLLDTEPGLSEKLVDFLNKYLISEDVELTDASDTLAYMGVYGPRAKDVLDPSFLSVPAGYPGAEGFDVLVPRADLASFVTRVLERGAVRVGFDALETIRVEGGIPRYGQDMEETTIPLEANLERAINYEKGCYIGQEVIARATFRGQVSRKLTGLLLGDANPPPKSELKKGDKKVGWITSVTQSPRMNQMIALGYVHRDSLEPGTILSLGGTTATAVVHPLPFKGG